MENFNLVLIAKQLWRLISEPDSLVAQFFKEKYFEIMVTNVRGNASLIWRSLTATRCIINTRARWRVGDGACIKIWKDRWLPKSTSVKVQSPISTLHEDACVQKDYRSWNTTLVQNLFWEAQTILFIPLIALGRPDKLIWGISENGLFLVRSAYQAALIMKRFNLGEGSRMESRNS